MKSIQTSLNDAPDNGRDRPSSRIVHAAPSLGSRALGATSVILLVLNTVFWCGLLSPFALLKLVLPKKVTFRRIDPILNRIATSWIGSNNLWFERIQRQPWDISGVDGLVYADWYLVNCNHQSWVDIFLLQRALGGRIPLLKFFLKQQLIYVPMIGLAWWALDFPFMKRHKKTQLRKNPELRRQDQETARRACEKFSAVPTSVMVFAEGTRFTPAKRDAQGSPYRHLLKPKAGGLAVTLNTMGTRFRSILDVTIVYPDGAPSFWDFACGRTGRVVLHVRQLPIPENFCTADYGTDSVFRKQFHRWLAKQWEEKDEQISQVLDGARGPGAMPHQECPAP